MLHTPDQGAVEHHFYISHFALSVIVTLQEHHRSVYTQVICTLVFSDLLPKVFGEYCAGEHIFH